MSFTASLFQTSANVPVMPVIRGVIGLSAFAGLAMGMSGVLTAVLLPLGLKLLGFF